MKKINKNIPDSLKKEKKKSNLKMIVILKIFSLS